MRANHDKGPWPESQSPWNKKSLEEKKSVARRLPLAQGYTQTGLTLG